MTLYELIKEGAPVKEIAACAEQMQREAECTLECIEESGESHDAVPVLRSIALGLGFPKPITVEGVRDALSHLADTVLVYVSAGGVRVDAGSAGWQIEFTRDGAVVTAAPEPLNGKELLVMADCIRAVEGLR